MRKKAKKSSHGGPRPGSGRPQKYDEPVVRKSVTVPESLFEWAKSQGKPFSVVVTEALEAMRK